VIKKNIKKSLKYNQINFDLDSEEYTSLLHFKHAEGIESTSFSPPIDNLFGQPDLVQSFII